MGRGRLFSQNKYEPKYLRQDDKAFNDLTIRTDNSGWIEFKKEAKLNPNNFFKDYANSLGLDKDYNFKATKDETDDKRQRHQRFQLFYKNIAVEGVEYLLHSGPDGILTLAHGRIPENMDFDVSKSMPEPKALDIALANIKVTLADLKKLERKRPDGILLLARLGDEAVNANFKLCWVFDVRGNETLNAFKVYVDANSGEVIKKSPLFRTCFGHSHNSPITPTNTTTSVVEPIPVTTAPLVASTFTPNNNRYLNAAGGLGFDTDIDTPTRNRLSAFNNALNTRMAVNGNADWALLPDVFNLATNQFNASNWTLNQDSRNAQTAHWLTQRMHQMMQQSLGRNGLNGQGLYPRVVTDLPFFDASWNGIDQMTFGRVNPAVSLVAADVVGHEYMHGVNDYTANLVYQGESGALDEGIADIFGTALERNIMGNPQSTTSPNGWNWFIGEDFLILRNMANPAEFGDPVSYDDANWADTGEDDDDFGGVHTNSGVVNRWFHTISTGQRIGGQTMLAVGFDKSLAIVYRALTMYLQSSSNYADMRNATVQAAKDFNNGDACAYEPFAVAKAWDDANVNGFTCTNTCDFNLTASSFNSNPACGAAFTLNAACSGANCGGVSYTWTGSGGVKYGQQVSYNAPNSNGSYTYNLTASRSGCSNKTASVTVNVTSCGGNSCVGGNFNGHFDSGNCGVFNGWALDHNDYGRTVDVEIRVDGVLVATVPANQSRPDLVGAFGTPAAEFHGWWYYPPANAPRFAAAMAQRHQPHRNGSYLWRNF